MLLVGVAVRLGVLPSVVREAPWQDVLEVAAYCELEAERYEDAKAGSAQTAPPPEPTPAPGGRGRTTTQTRTIQYVLKTKE